LKFREYRLERAAKAVLAQDPQAGLALLRAADLGKERILNDINDMVSVEFFERGLEAAMSVGRVDAGGSTGTGFLVGPNVMLTNYHVLSSADDATLAKFELDAEENRFGETKRIQCFHLSPQKFWVASEELDFAFVAVEPHSTEGAPLARYGWHPLIVGEGKIRLGEGVSIIQHPGGQVKMVAVHNARLIQLRNGVEDEAFCFYSCDTDRGSSGSPVFNSRWEVIALHHSAVPETDDKGRVALKADPRRLITMEEALGRATEVAWVANEGIRVSRLVAGFERLDLDPAFAPSRSELLDLWKRSDVLAMSRPHMSGPLKVHSKTGNPAFEIAPSGAAGYGSIDVPITLSIRIGAHRSATRD
jgi:endonuclease G